MAATNPLPIARGLTRRPSNNTAVANLKGAWRAEKGQLPSLTDATGELRCYKVRIGACACQNMALRVLVPCMGLCVFVLRHHAKLRIMHSGARAINNSAGSGHSIRPCLVSANGGVGRAACVATIAVAPAAELSPLTRIFT